MDEVTSVI